MKYGLVLAGGGARGAYQIGVWRALREMKINITAISGASIGAVNGALFAQGDCKKAEELWRGISMEDIVSLPDGIKDTDNLFAIKNIAEILKEVYKNNGLDMSPLENLLNTVIDEKKLRKSPVDFGIATFSVTKKNGVCKFKADIPDGEIVSYIMASACLPGFKMKEVEREKFLDGAVFNNMPVDMMVEKDVDNIITVDVKGIGIYKDTNLAGRNVISIKCAEPKTGIMGFDTEGIERSISDGYIDCLKAFGRLTGKIYAFKNDDYAKARMKYSKELIEGIEKAAKAFGISNSRIYGVQELISLTMESYFAYTRKTNLNIKENPLDIIRQADDSMFVAIIVKMLESGKNDFVMEKMSLLGTNYEAASAILYFKRQKSYCI